jgi:signal peptidase II
MTDVDEDPQRVAARPPHTVSLPVRRGRLLVLVVAAALTYVTDLITKIIAVHQLAGRKHPVDVFGSVFNLELVRNPGAAFGLGVGMTIVFSAVSVAVIVAILRTASRLGSVWWALVFGLVLGGALGNLTDRIFRAPGFGRGHVVDFLHITHWPVFNVADSAFCVAGGIVVVLAVKNVPIEGRRSARPDRIEQGHD